MRGAVGVVSDNRERCTHARSAVCSERRHSDPACDKPVLLFSEAEDARAGSIVIRLP